MTATETSKDVNVSSTIAPSRMEGHAAVSLGCLAALASAVLTCGLLFINGSLVLAILEASEESGFSMVQQEGFSQFMLFAMPVALVVVQWMMIDYVRARFSHRNH